MTSRTVRPDLSRLQGERAVFARRGFQAAFPLQDDRSGHRLSSGARDRAVDGDHVRPEDGRDEYERHDENDHSFHDLSL